MYTSFNSKLLLCFAFWQQILQFILCRTIYDVSELVVEPDFRSVYLKWKYQPKSELEGFTIRYCEITNWHVKVRCKEQLAKLNSITNKIKFDNDDPIIQLNQIDFDQFEASINNLRMLSNYSVNVKADLGQISRTKSPDQLDLEDLKQNILVETKSFAAKTLKCLANSSEIQVQTGPYFGGKISVEGSNNPLCAIYGDRNSAQSIYNFSINHNICNSKIINNSRIEAMVIVHENKEILTHNSKRYLVVCTFAPESYTLTASVVVPSHLLKKLFDRMREKQVQISIDTDQNVNNTNKLVDIGKKKRFATHRNQFFETNSTRHSNLRDSRMLEPDGLVKHVMNNDDNEFQNKLFKPQANFKSQLLENNLTIITSMLSLCVLIFLYLFLLRSSFNINNRNKSMSSGKRLIPASQNNHAQQCQQY